MDKCPICIVGKMISSGTHNYCDRCNFSVFVVTQEYLQACHMMLGTLCSNTSFNSEAALSGFLYDTIEKHLPMLFNHMRAISNKHKEFMALIVEAVKVQAINLQVAATGFNIEERSLACQCGSKSNFDLSSPGEVACLDCGAVYRFDQEQNTYIPYFLCGCGYAAYDKIDDLLVVCKQCGVGYMHNKVEDTFTMVRQ